MLEQTPDTPQASPLRARLPWIVVVVVAVVALFGYSVREHNAASRLASQNDRMQASLQQTQAQIDALTSKLTEMSAAQAAQNQPAPSASPARPAAGHRSARRARRDDPRWKQVQSELQKHQQEIESTQQDLTNARTELSGSIARTHGELVTLQRKGERNYYEFSIDKSKGFSRVGPMGLRVRKANEKHQYADLELMVDDRTLQKKHVNLYEPAMFYMSDSDQPVQVVINSVTKNHIKGYIAEPKYRPGQLQALAQGQEDQQRVKLPTPK
jgi:DNA-binding protein YbaB